MQSGLWTREIWENFGYGASAQLDKLLHDNPPTPPHPTLFLPILYYNILALKVRIRFRLLGLFWCPPPCQNIFLVGCPLLAYCCEARLLVAGSIGDNPQQEQGETKPVLSFTSYLWVF